MAFAATPDPNELMRRVTPRAGPYVQNSAGLAPNTAPLANRPPAPPAVNTGTPGPKPIGRIAGVAPPPAMTGLGVAPAAPAAASAAAPKAGGGGGAAAAPASAGIYGASGGTSASAPAGSLEGSLWNYISGALGGVTSKAFIDRAKNQLGSATEGQRAQAVRRGDEDLIRRGLFRSGMGADVGMDAERSAQGAFSSGLANILSSAEQQDIAGRESAAGVAGNLLAANRSWDQYLQQRADEQAARNRGGGAPQDTSFTYIDPDTGASYEMDESWF